MAMGKTRDGKNIPTYYYVKKGSREEPGSPEHPKEEPIIKEAEIEEEASPKMALVHEVQWNKEIKHTQTIRIKVSDKNFLRAILKKLNGNIKSETEFEWSPLVWCEDPEHTTINAIVKEINENDMIELESFINEIKSTYSVTEIQK